MRALLLLAALLLSPLGDAHSFERGETLPLRGKVACTNIDHARAFLEERAANVQKAQHSFVVSSQLVLLKEVPTGCHLKDRHARVVREIESRHVQRPQGTFVKLSLLLLWPHDHMTKGNPGHIFVIIEDNVPDQAS
jgi:hypothetical protein